MNPCVLCRNKGNCPKHCKPKADYIRHMNRLNRKLRKREERNESRFIQDKRGTLRAEMGD